MHDLDDILVITQVADRFADDDIEFFFNREVERAAADGLNTIGNPVLCRQDPYHAYHQLVHIDRDNFPGAQFRGGDRPNPGPCSDIQNDGSLCNGLFEGRVERLIAHGIAQQCLMRF